MQKEDSTQRFSRFAAVKVRVRVQGKKNKRQGFQRRGAEGDEEEKEETQHKGTKNTKVRGERGERKNFHRRGRRGGRSGKGRKMMSDKRQGLARSLIFLFLTPTPTPSPTHPEGTQHRGAEGDEGEEQKENSTQGQKNPSLQITSHESQITVERSETQHKVTKSQRSEGKGSDG